MVHKRIHHEIAIRRLYPTDTERICKHFRRLDLTSRRARFCGTISDDGVSEYARSVFRNDGILTGAFVDRHLRGLVELRGVLPCWPSTAEAAISVEPDWQNIGIGDALFERTITMAQNRGVRSIALMCLKENCRMRHLAEKHNAQLQFDQDIAQGILHPNRPTLASLAAELVGETMGISAFLGLIARHPSNGRCDPPWYDRA